MRLVQLVGAEDGFRQGDIVRFTSSEACPYGATLGVILTADCDLAQGKHYGQALLAPIVSACTYFDEIWCPRKASQLAARVQERVTKLLVEAQNRGILAAISPETVEAITASEDAMRLALDGIQGLAEGTKDELRKLARCTQIILDERQCHKDRLMQALAHKDGKPISLVFPKQIETFKQDLNQDSLDVITISDEISSGEFVKLVLLRCPFSFPLSAINRKSSHEEGVSIRLGRFIPEIKYLISNRFGNLFSRVGMPKQIEDDRTESVEVMEMKYEPFAGS